MFCPLRAALKLSLGLLAVWGKGSEEEGGKQRCVCVCVRAGCLGAWLCPLLFVISTLNPPGIRHPESKEASLKHYDPAHNYPQMS